MVLSASDYDLRNLYQGGVDPTSPVDTATLIVGSLIVLSVIFWAVGWSQNKGSSMVNSLMGRLTGGVASSSGDVEVFN